MVSIGASSNDKESGSIGGGYSGEILSFACLESKVGIEPHSGPVEASAISNLCFPRMGLTTLLGRGNPRTIGNGTCARATGRLVRAPKVMEAMPAIDAVAVTKSRLISWILSVH